MMGCIRFVSYSIKLNGKPRGKILPTKGPHQRDLLSPYLFLICAEGLSTLIQVSEEQGLIRGVLACTRVVLSLFNCYPEASSYVSKIPMRMEHSTLIARKNIRLSILPKIFRRISKENLVQKWFNSMRNREGFHP